MPYCAKCGIEVDKKEKNCPLCQFPIPYIEGLEDEHEEEAFPIAQNIYPDRVIILKHKIFLTIIIVLLASVPILLAIKAFIPSTANGIHYALISIAATIFCVYFLFGYLSLHKNILGISLTTILLTYLLDAADHKMTWFYNVALYIILLATLIVLIYTYLYKRSKHRNQFVYIPTYILSAIGLLTVAMESVVSYRINDKIQLTWSLIVLGSTFGVCLLLLGLYHGLPDNVKAKLKRKLHI